MQALSTHLLCYPSYTLQPSLFWVEEDTRDFFLVFVITVVSSIQVLFFLILLDTFEMVSEDEDGKLGFKINYHYMSQVKNANDANSAARARRLAQEAVTLSTSLPLSSSSSVFVRCDEERLDIMKVEK
jgi:hypothetical protein